MANWTILKTAIADAIKANGNQEITGPLLQATLINIVNALGEYADFAGIAVPSTSPGVTDGPVFYLACAEGIYPNFDSIRLGHGEVVILRRTGLSWVKESLLEAATKADLAFVVNLGTFDRAEDAEELAASYADNRNVILMYFKISNARSGFFLQSFSNSSATIQFYYLSGRKYVRQVSWYTGNIGSWVDVTGAERIQQLVYDEYNHTIKFKDALGDPDWGGVQLPIASKENYIPGLVGTETLIELERVKDRTLNEIPPYSGEIENADIVLQGTSTPSAIVYIRSKGVFAAKSGGTYYSAWPSTSLFPAQEMYNEGVTIGETHAIPRKLYYLQARDTSTLNSGLRYFDGSSFIEIPNTDEVNILNERIAKNTTNIAANAKELTTKAPKVGYAPDLKVDFAKELVGRGVAEPQEIGTIRPTGVISIGDGNATIDKIKGKSVVWNQLVIDYNFSKGLDRWGLGLGVQSGTINEDGSIRLVYKGGVMNQDIRKNNLTIPIGHKVAVYTDCLVQGSTKNVCVQVNGTTNRAKVVQGRNIYKYIFDVTRNDYKDVRFCYVESTDDNPEYIDLHSNLLYDLTKMFGAGNEPATIEEFEARKPLGVSDDYNEGEIISYDAKELKSVGFNAFNGSYAKVIGGQQYHALGTITSIGFTTEVGGETTEVTLDSEGKFTPSETGYVYAEGTDICIHLTHTYTPEHTTEYEEDILTLPDVKSIKDKDGNPLFPYGLLSAGSAYDEISATKAIKRIGVVDMGTLRYDNYTDDTSLFSAYRRIPLLVLRGNGLLCARYKTVDDGYRDYNQENKTIKIWSATKGFFVRDTSYTDPATFKQAMQGVLLYYELESPIEVDLPEPLNLTYDAWDFGTEELVAEGKTTPLNADIVYQFNAVDRIRENTSKNQALEAEVAQLKAMITQLTQMTNEETNKTT